MVWGKWNLFANWLAENLTFTQLHVAPQIIQVSFMIFNLLLFILVSVQKVSAWTGTECYHSNVS